jgi:hypothetical protein
MTEIKDDGSQPSLPNNDDSKEPKVPNRNELWLGAHKLTRIMPNSEQAISITALRPKPSSKTK